MIMQSTFFQRIAQRVFNVHFEHNDDCACNGCIDAMREYNANLLRERVARETTNYRDEQRDWISRDAWRNSNGDLS
jgi:hypothetical protein